MASISSIGSLCRTGLKFLTIGIFSFNMAVLFRDYLMFIQMPPCGETTTLSGMTLCRAWQEHATSRLPWVPLPSSLTWSRMSLLPKRRMMLVYMPSDFTLEESHGSSRLMIHSFSPQVPMELEYQFMLLLERTIRCGACYWRKLGPNLRELTRTQTVVSSKMVLEHSLVAQLFTTKQRSKLMQTRFLQL